MIPRCRWLILLLPFLAGASPESPDTAIEVSPTAPLQGSWKLIRNDSGPAGGWSPGDMKVKGNVVTGLLYWGRKPEGGGTFSYKLHPTRNEIDLIINRNGDRTDYQGIYQVEGDTLMLAIAVKERPRSYSSTISPEAGIFLWRRTSPR